MTVWLVIYTHRHGDDVAAYVSESLAWEAAAEIVDEWVDEQLSQENAATCRMLLEAGDHEAAVSDFVEGSKEGECLRVVGCEVRDSVVKADLPSALCVHCQRRIVQQRDGKWVDPEATGDDRAWRETCDKHDTFVAEHEPAELTCGFCGAELARDGTKHLPPWGEHEEPIVAVVHPEHVDCADGCGLAVTHLGACRDTPGGSVICDDANHRDEEDE